MPRIRSLYVAMLLASSVAQADTLELLTESQPPFSAAINDRKFGRGSEVLGSGTELLRDICSRAAVVCQFTLRYPWSRVYQQAVDSAGHGVYPATRSHQRESYFKWVGPIAVGDWVLLARSDAPLNLHTLREASVYRTGGYRHPIVSRYLKEYGVPVRLALKDEDNLKRLQDGEIDLWATDVATARSAVQESAGSLKIAFSFTDDIYLALNSTTPDAVVQRLQTALTQVRGERGQ